MRILHESLPQPDLVGTLERIRCDVNAERVHWRGNAAASAEAHASEDERRLPSSARSDSVMAVASRTFFTIAPLRFAMKVR